MKLFTDSKRTQRFFSASAVSLVGLLTALSVQSASAAVRCEELFVKVPAPESQKVSQNKISRDYLMVANWMDNIFSTLVMVAPESQISYIAFPQLESVSLSKAAVKKFGSISSEDWKPKKNIKDLSVQDEILAEIKDITQEFIIEMKSNPGQKAEQVARQEADKKILKVFEDAFGRLPEKLITESEFGARLQSIQKSNLQSEYAKLSPRQLELLKKHPIAKFAARIGDGEDLAFSSMHFKVSNQVNLYKGERSQAIFIQKILSALFPKARYVDHGLDAIPGRKRVHIMIADLAERFAGENHRIKEMEDKGAVLPMNLGKAANLRDGRKDKKQARTELGLPLDRKIVHMYIRSEDTLTSLGGASQFSALFAAMNKFSPLDIVVITFGNNSKNFSFARSGAPTSFPWSSKTLVSQLNNSKNLPIRTIIENDTVGKVVDLHAAADYSVIVGPVNFFEPLNVGTPTLLIAKTYAEERISDYKNYDRETLMQYAQLAEQSGIFRSLEIDRKNTNYEPVTKILQELSVAQESPAPLTDITFPLFLDALQRHLSYQLTDFDPQDYQGLNFP